ncbi:MAG TPA: hypothetical protein VGD37_43555, partial [Kofleriaceae bacterium]
WSALDPAGQIDDPALEVPLPIEAMVHAAKADDAVARALLARHNPVLDAHMAQTRAEGVEEGAARARPQLLAEAVLAVLTARKLVLDAAQRARILGEADVVQLERWLARAATCTAVGELFPEGGG